MLIAPTNTNTPPEKTNLPPIRSKTIQKNLFGLEATVETALAGLIERVTEYESNQASKNPYFLFYSTKIN